MIVEGKGLIAPAPLQHRISDREIRNLYAIASENGAKYGKRRDSWGKGLLGGLDVPGVGCVNSHILPMLLGVVGEYATHWKLYNTLGKGIEWNSALSESGDGGTDLTAFGLRMNVKCRTRNYGEVLVRRVYRRRIKPLDYDIVVGCQWDIRTNRNVVLLLGWMWVDQLRECGFAKARVGEHFNLAARNEQLSPISSLVAELRSRKDSARWR